MADVLVAGAGPAGWAAAAACARLGLDTVLVSPNPHARWPATYGMWADECAALPPGSRWVGTPATRVVGLTERRLDRGYVVLDNESVRTALHGPRTVAGAVAAVRAGPRGCTVGLRDGRVLAAAVVIDATGAARNSGAEQTAYGVAIPGDTVDETVFMDWRPPPGCDPGTFLYTVPLPDGRVLFEETSLAARPGLGFTELRARLRARFDLTGGTVERVRIPVDLPLPRNRSGVIAFGAAAAMVHPATGYSIADTFRLAPRLAQAIADGLRHSPRAAVRAGRHTVWPPAARATHLLRRRGLAVLLALPPHRLPEFFELFFALPADLQRRYLGARDDPAGTAAAMLAIFRAASPSLRAIITRHAAFGATGRIRWSDTVNMALTL
jgi:lycopene beta-cyclase